MKAKIKPQKNSEDIINLILDDHRPLKKLIKTLKSSEIEVGEKVVAFEEFAPLLMNHSKQEEKSLYEFMDQNEDLVCEGFEGEEEHKLADQLIGEIKATTDDDRWSAKIKVLAELVEHHIKEEEEQMLPDFKKNSDTQERSDLGRKYLDLKEEYETEHIVENGVFKQKRSEAPTFKY